MAPQTTTDLQSKRISEEIDHPPLAKREPPAPVPPCASLDDAFGAYREIIDQIQSQGASDRAATRTFKVLSSRTTVEVEVRAAPPESPPLGGHANVLLVEDDPMVRGLAERVLGQLGYQVFSAATPHEALAQLAARESVIDLLLTDVMLPGMDGWELWEQLRLRVPALKCLFMSGYRQDVLAQRGALVAGVPFLPKPFTIRELAAQVRKATQRTGVPAG